MKFLTVDDAKVIRSMLSNIVKRHVKQADVFEAEHGRNGLKILEQNKDMDMIFVDWNMPIMNGLDFVKHVRADSSYNGVKIIMVTTESDRSKVTTAAKEGINGYIVKPFTQEILEKVINKYIKA